MVEQPENSVLEFFPPFQAVLAALHDAFGGCAVPIHCKQVYKSYIYVAKVYRAHMVLRYTHFFHCEEPIISIYICL